MNTFASTLIAVAMLTACGSKPELDVGDETRVTGEALSDYAADWDGYIEAFQVAGDGSDRVRITLDEQGEGTIRFGDQALIEPATDPNGVYPPPGDYDDYTAGVQSGFEYPIINSSVSSKRLQFEFDLGVVHDSWCALQPLEAEREFSCSAGGSYSNDPETGMRINCRVDTEEGLMPVDCEAHSACRRCECDETTCKGKFRGPLSVDTALADEGESLTGTLVLSTGERVTIRLSR